MIVFRKTCIGYKHLNNNISCEDNSLCYSDNDNYLIAIADGHGGDLYVRSRIGSKLACEACKTVFDKVKTMKLNDDNISNLCDKLRLDLLCRWNKLVKNHYKNNKFDNAELSGLNSKDLNRLNSNYVLAYGTTLHTVMFLKDYVICLSIGDGGTFLLTKDSTFNPFDEYDDESVANLTTSLCSDNAYNYIHAEYYKREDIIGALSISDGILNLYQTYENFNSSFINCITEKLDESGEEAVPYIKDFVSQLGLKSGNGDDVSLAMIYDESSSTDLDYSNLED